MTAAAARAVQTSAPPPEPDLFPEDRPVRPEAYAQFYLVGIVIADAEVHMAPVGDGTHVVPVLRVRLQGLQGLAQVIEAEQIFSDATLELAHQKAAALKRGTQVQLLASTADMRIHLPHVQSITAHS